MTDSTTSRQPPGTTPSAPKVSSTYSHSRFGTLFSRHLPDYSGEYPVGALDVEFPIEKQTIGSFRHKKLKTDDPVGIEIDTVLFTLFYPCVVSPSESKGTVWFPRAASTVKGFLQMAGMENSILRRLAYVGALPAVHGLKFPTYQRAPILPPPSPSGKWPLIIFSHGVGCSRLMYTQICGELASRGYVVAAVEHRDGTGPSARITSEEGQVRDVDFLRWTDLNWPELEEQPKDDTTLRHDQLKIRLAELDSTLQVIRKIVQGRHVQPALMASRTLDWEPWKNVVEVGDGRVCFAGHSFGGTAVIAAAADPRFTPSSIIALDPAVQRIEPWTSTISCPTLSVNSEEFGHQEDYERLLGVSKTVNAEKHIFTIAGATHPSFSDVFLITPGFVGSLTSLSVPPYEVFVRTLEVIETFLRGTTESAKELESVGTPITTMPPKPIGKPGEVFRQVE